MAQHLNSDSQSGSDQFNASRRRVSKTCMLWIHGESFSKQHVLFNASVLPAGSFRDGSLLSVSFVRHAASGEDASTKERSLRHRLDDAEGSTSSKRTDDRSDSHGIRILEQARFTPKFLFIAHDMDPEQKSKHPQLQLSVSEDVARLFGFENRSTVLISEEDQNDHGASHIDISFRDVYLARGDMWRMVSSELNDTAVFEGQKILFLSTIKAFVKKIYIRGQRVRSAKFSGASRVVFRSESARFVIYIQLSREMWEFDDASGDIMFNKVIYGFLPELFKRWSDLKVRHLVTIVLFTRARAAVSQGQYLGTNAETVSPWHGNCDFYRVVTSDMSSGDWAAILTKLKQDFKIFLRDVSTQSTASNLKSEQNSHQSGFQSLSDATNGNILEAINLAAAHFERDYVDRDLARTGLSIIVITPGSGVFDVDEALLQLTTERLINNGIGIDLVCLSRKPLHSVPLFKYAKRNSPKQLGETSNSQHGASARNSRSPYWNNDTSTAMANQWLPSFHANNSRDANHEERPSAELQILFAMPHWINISFWEALPTNILQQKPRLSGKQNAVVDFKPHCRMYEIQMMGYMENEASNISIPYLHQHMNSIRAQKHRDFNNHLDAQHGRSLEKASFTGQPWASVRPSEKGYDSNKYQGESSSRNDNELVVRMEMYDNEIFTPPAQSGPRGIDDDALGEDVVRDSVHEKTAAPNISNSKSLRTKSSTPSIDSKTGRRSTTLPSSLVSEDQPGQHMKPKEQSKKGLLSLSLAYQRKASAVTGSSMTDPMVSSFTYKPTEGIKTGTGMPDGSISEKVRKSLTRTTTESSTTSTEYSKPIAIQDTETTDKRSAANDNVQVTRSEVQAQAKPALAGVLNKASNPRQTRPRDNLSKSPAERLYMKESNVNTSPWLTLLNPSNPQPESRQRASDYNRWQHVFPLENFVAPIKWDSLCTPASLPLTNGYFPSHEQLRNSYTESPYKIAIPEGEDEEEMSRNRQRLARELINFRLSKGFQIVTSTENDPAPRTPTKAKVNVYEPGFMAEVGDEVRLSKGNTIHHLVCGDTDEIQVTLFKKYSAMDNLMERLSAQPYEPKVRALTADEYTGRYLRFSLPEDDYSWNYVDNFVAGYQIGDIDRLRCWRSRFVLLPMESNSLSRKGLSTLPEDSDEETRIEGLRKLTQMWQRFRHIPLEERRHHAALNLKKDPNPLKIEFQTRDPSVVVSLGFDNTLLTEGEAGAAPTQLFAPDSDPYKTTSFDLHKLAGDIQGDKGIRIQNRRWHWKLHLASFVGADLTTWLLANFADIDSREEAVDLGNVLMEKGLIQHVSKKHKFRDGHFFFTFTDEYLVARPESRMSWFGSTRRTDRVYPLTPSAEFAREVSSPDPRRKLEASEEVIGSTAWKKPFVSLSSKITYDVDPRKRSDRPELIDLHYDRLHNPGNAFHIQLVWSRATGGLIEESVANWSMLAEKHGLRLVQVPIFEALSLSHVHPFREPHPIELAILPPRFNPTESGQIMSPRFNASEDRYIYHKEILKKLNYVLDVEAATNFPNDVDVTFSWGKPDYKASQYIHKSGLLLMQIAADGRFLLVANRLCNNRILARDSAKFEKADPGDRRGHQSRDAAFASPAFRAVQEGSPMAPLFIGNDSLQVTAAQLKDEFEEFCGSKERLQVFYEEVLKSEESQLSTPHILPMEASIPKLGLPPPLEAREHPAITASRQSYLNKALGNASDPKEPDPPEQANATQPPPAAQ